MRKSAIPCPSIIVRRSRAHAFSSPVSSSLFSFFSNGSLFLTLWRALSPGKIGAFASFHSQLKHSSQIFLGQTRQENRSQSTMVADVMARNNENQNVSWIDDSLLPFLHFGFCLGFFVVRFGLLDFLTVKFYFFKQD